MVLQEFQPEEESIGAVESQMFHYEDQENAEQSPQMAEDQNYGHLEEGREVCYYQSLELVKNNNC